MRQRAPLIVILHQHGPGKRPQTVHQRSRRDRSREVRHDTHKMGFANRRNLHHLSNAAHIRQSRPDIVQIVMLNQLVPEYSAPLVSRARPEQVLPALEASGMLVLRYLLCRLYDAEVFSSSKIGNQSWTCRTPAQLLLRLQAGSS